jgi:hypothetical protein
MAESFLTFTVVTFFVIKKRVTKRWDVQRADNHEYLGEVKWLAIWRRYAFFPNKGTAYDGTCLFEISEFCNHQTLARKLERVLKKDKAR